MLLVPECSSNLKRSSNEALQDNLVKTFLMSITINYIWLKCVNQIFKYNQLNNGLDHILPYYEQLQTLKTITYL